MSITLQATDSKKKVRTLTVSGFLNDCGTKCARILSDNGKEYFVRVKANGTSTCTCESRKPCYHIKAIASITLPTVEEMEQALAANRVGTIVVNDVLAEAQAAMEQFDRDCDPNAYEVLGATKQTTVCPFCHKHDEHYNRYGKCYWMPLGEAL